MNPSGLLLTDVMPEATARRVAQAVAEFRQARLSGHVDIRLNFRCGEPQPSDMGIHERQVRNRNSS